MLWNFNMIPLGARLTIVQNNELKFILLILSTSLFLPQLSLLSYYLTRHKTQYPVQLSVRRV